MQITNEEMETLNRATEILSRFVDVGAIKKESFDLFEKMVILSIDSGEDHGDYKRKLSSESPYSRLILPYMLGYYNEENEPKLFCDVNIVNLHIIGDILSFEIYNRKLEELFRTIKDFSIAPVLAMTKDDDSRFYIRHFKQVSEAHDTIDASINVEKCDSVNAPFDTFVPIVFECSVESLNNDFFPKLTAIIHKVNILESSRDCDGEFDICSAWARMGWEEQGEISE